ncbi:MAG: response regulator [Thermoleophilia bacterium]|nr:response regulator [Thermoleophilia bacterium]
MTTPVAHMRELRATYRHGLGSVLEALRIAAASLAADGTNGADSIRRLAHQLNGSGASYGFPEITDRASSVLAASGDELAHGVEELIAVVADVAAGGEPAATILVVDDDPTVRHLLEATLAARGHEVRCAGSVEAATQLLEPGVSAIVLDLFLSDGDGRRFLLDLRSQPAFARLPVIMISARGTDLARAECRALGADAFIDKPFDPAEFAVAVEGALASPGAAGPAPQPAPATAASAEPASILVAEDDELTAALVVDRLDREGHRVVHRRDGAAALEAARNEPVSLAILDVKMPGMDGFEVLGRLRELESFQSVPVLMLTSMGGEHDVVRGFSLGADDYILKPFSPGELTARVRRLLERS